MYTNYHHLIPGVSTIKSLSLYVFALWGRDLVSVVHIKKGLYYRGFFERKCVRVLMGHRKLSVIERCLYQRGSLKERFNLITICILMNCLRKT